MDAFITFGIVAAAAFYLYRKFSRSRSGGCGCSSEGGCCGGGSHGSSSGCCNDSLHK